MGVNIYDIANKTGLSVVTVSRVLNNNPKVRQSNRQKVEAAMKELDYRPNAAARILSSGKTSTVAVVVPSLMDAFIIQVLSAIEKELKANGMFLVVATAADDTDFADSIYASLFMEGRVDGILILSPIYDNGYYFELKKRNIPFVLLDREQFDLQVPSVSVDNFLGGYEATMSLVRRGCKKIAHITGAECFQSSSERLRGYLAALEDCGMEAGDGMIVSGDFTPACGFKAVSDWLESGNMPDAVFASDDNTAFGVLNAAQMNGVSVPVKLAVIGYDDHPYASMLNPKLSTVRQPTEEMGITSVNMLLDIIEGKLKRNMKTVLKPTIILRETT